MPRPAARCFIIPMAVPTFNKQRSASRAFAAMRSPPLQRKGPNPGAGQRTEAEASSAWVANGMCAPKRTRKAGTDVSSGAGAREIPSPPLEVYDEDLDLGGLVQEAEASALQ